MSFKRINTKKRENGLKTFIYKSGSYIIEIDQLSNKQFCIANANFEYLSVNTYAKTIRTLFSRLENLFI